jgi:AhpD family alkylhydroperoxidase
MQDHRFEQKISSYKQGIDHLGRLLPDVADSYNRFTGECFADGSVSAKNKQLVALGISLFANNEICTAYHTEEALHEGASQQEILEVAAVAAAVGGGHCMAQGVTRVQQILESSMVDANY